MSISNLVRWKSSKIYFARVKINGRLIRKSLDTSLMSVARNRLTDLIKQERERAEVSTPNVEGKMTFAEAVKIFLDRLDGNPDLKPSTKKYRRQCVKAIIKTWPGIETTELRKITKPACQEWARHLRQHGTKFRPPGAKKEREGISSSRFNNTVTTLRQILKIAVETGIIAALGQQQQTATDQIVIYLHCKEIMVRLEWCNRSLNYPELLVKQWSLLAQLMISLE